MPGGWGSWSGGSPPSMPSRTSCAPSGWALAPWLALDIPLETASTPEVAVSFGTVAASADLDVLERELAEKAS